MATQNWPVSGTVFIPDTLRWSASTPKTAFVSPYTGQVQSFSQLADRLRVSMTFPPCKEPGAGQREAFFQALASAGDWVLLWHFFRPVPNGTLRGTPTVYAAAAAGARSIQLQTTAGATLLAGDMLGAPSQLLQCGYAGATADGTGLLTMPLVLPLRKAVSAGAALTWSQPTGTFQITTVQPETVYAPGGFQQALEVVFSEVYA